MTMAHSSHDRYVREMRQREAGRPTLARAREAVEESVDKPNND
jgi:hypothetical protein